MKNPRLKHMLWGSLPPAAHPLQQLQSLLVQQVALSQVADCVLQVYQLVQVLAVALLEILHLLLQVDHHHLKLLFAQAALVGAVCVKRVQDTNIH